jgi:hypothetical protein
MYGAATYRMRAAVELSRLEWLPKATLGVALTAWLATFAGLAHHGITTATATARNRR